MSKGRYGEYGGQYISETLMNELIYLEEQYNHYMNDPDFVEELNTLLKEYAGRPSLLYYAKRMTEDIGGAKIYLKREDLNHTGSHKINHSLGEALLAKKLIANDVNEGDKIEVYYDKRIQGLNIRDKVERAKNNPIELVNLLCKDFNIRQNTINAWLTFDDLNNEKIYGVSRI